MVEAFPTLEALPCPAPPLEDLPAEFRTGQHLACQAAERMMFYGTLKDFELRPRLPLTQAQGDQVITLVCAHLGCFGYRHEHKVAWVGTLLDRWFKVSRGERMESTRDQEMDDVLSEAMQAKLARARD